MAQYRDMGTLTSTSAYACRLVPTALQIRVCSLVCSDFTSLLPPMFVQSANALETLIKCHPGTPWRSTMSRVHDTRFSDAAWPQPIKVLTHSASCTLSTSMSLCELPLTVPYIERLFEPRPCFVSSLDIRSSRFGVAIPRRPRLRRNLQKSVSQGEIEGRRLRRRWTPPSCF